MAFHCLVIVTVASQVVSVVLLVCITSGVDASPDASCNATCTYTAWARDANCRNLGLTQVPPGCSSSEMMDLRNNELQRLGPGTGSFRGYEVLRYLDLEFNQIATIIRGAFQGCVSLQNIYLQFNILTEVGEGAFEGATDLKRLFLNQNTITAIHPDAFRGLDTLNGLYIGNNDINNLPMMVFQHTPSLQYLHMGDNGLAMLPRGIFDELTELTYLNMENNNLRFIAGSLFEHLTSLQELNLSGNLITSMIGFPTLPSLRILDLFDNDLRDLGGLSKNVSRLDQLYLAENDNLSCKCSLNPVREWIINHQSDKDVDAIKANVTCGGGRALCHLTKRSLCPTHRRFFGYGKPAPPTELTAVRTTECSNVYEPPAPGTKEKRKQSSSGLSPVTVYILVGGATLIAIILVLIVLVKCLDWRARKYRRQQASKRQQRPVQQQHREQNVPMMPVPTVPTAPNRRIEEDEGAYEPVRLRPHSPTSDSAFGSQDDVNAAEEAQVWQDPVYRVPSYDSDDSGAFRHPNPPYMATGEWSPSHSHQPTDEEITQLARELHNNNPFMDDMTQEYQTVLTADEPLHQKPVTTPYVPHTVFAQTQSYFPGDISTHSALDKPRRKSTNPFENSTNTNPFISCA